MKIIMENLYRESKINDKIIKSYIKNVLKLNTKQTLNLNYSNRSLGQMMIFS